jgi:hypothetical protein
MSFTNKKTFTRPATMAATMTVTCKVRPASFLRGDIVCEMCLVYPSTSQCNRCGESVCEVGDKCCMVFPHYNTDTFVVCSSCVQDVEKKFRPYIEQISTLKWKIRTGRTMAQMNRSYQVDSVTTSCSSASSSSASSSSSSSSASSSSEEEEEEEFESDMLIDSSRYIIGTIKSI